MSPLLRMLVIALLVVGCGSSAVGSSPPPPAASSAPPTAPPTPAPTPKPTVLSPAQAAAAHITESVTRLMSIDDPVRIEAWIAVEEKWVDTVASLPIVRPYLLALTDVLRQQAFEDPNPAVLALQIIAAARKVPGVELP